MIYVHARSTRHLKALGRGFVISDRGLGMHRWYTSGSDCIPLVSGFVCPLPFLPVSGLPLLRLPGCPFFCISSRALYGSRGVYEFPIHRAVFVPESSKHTWYAFHFAC